MSKDISAAICLPYVGKYYQVGFIFMRRNQNYWSSPICFICFVVNGSPTSIFTVGLYTLEPEHEIICRKIIEIASITKKNSCLLFYDGLIGVFTLLQLILYRKTTFERVEKKYFDCLCVVLHLVKVYKL